jgi:putative transposase
VEKRRNTSSLTDAQWKVLAKQLPSSMLDRQRKRPLRLLFDAIFYVLKNGVGWRDLPSDLPPYDTVNYYFNTWRDTGFFELLNLELSCNFRQSIGRERSPSVGILDSQSVKTVSLSAENAGFDGAKKIKGRKMHIMVDIFGLLLTVVVHSAKIQDRDGAKMLFEWLFENRWDFHRLKAFFADSGYAGICSIRYSFHSENWHGNFPLSNGLSHTNSRFCQNDGSSNEHSVG